MDEDSKKRFCYRIRDWEDSFEDHRTRDVKKTTWFPMSNRMDEDPYVDIVNNPDGSMHWGAWVVLTMIASRSICRGFLLKENGEPHTAESIAWLSRVPLETIETVIGRFRSLGLLELVEPPVVRRRSSTGEQASRKPPATEKAGESANESGPTAAHANGSPVNQEPPPPVEVISAGLSFEQWWEDWVKFTGRGVNEQRTRAQYDKLVRPLFDRRPFDECFQSYAHSREVVEGVVTNPDKWLRKNSEDQWRARWPRPKPAQAERVTENLERMHGGRK